MPQFRSATLAPPTSDQSLFDRVDRPQQVLVPTTTSLLAAQTRNKYEKSRVRPQDVRSIPLSPTISPPTPTCEETPDQPDAHELSPMITLGKLTQDHVRWAIRAQRGPPGLLIMVKKMEPTEKKTYHQLRHSNIAKVLHTFQEEGVPYIALEYCRITIAEMLHIKLKLGDRQVQYIARSVFDAISYLGQLGITHNLVNTKTIRITPDWRVLLSDFTHASKTQELSSYTNQDLEDLGFVLLECMQGHPLPTQHKQLQFIKQQREMNKVFGLSNAEDWSGSKQLIDFLGDLFSEDRPPIAKVTKRHRYVCARLDDRIRECLKPYVESVTLECYPIYELP